MTLLLRGEGRGSGEEEIVHPVSALAAQITVANNAGTYYSPFDLRNQGVQEALAAAREYAVRPIETTEPQPCP